jgi:hypothetical protein
MDGPGNNIKSLFPSLTEEQSKEAEENIEQYLAVVIRIYQRVSRDPEALAELRRDLQEPGDFGAGNSQGNVTGNPAANLPISLPASVIKKP